MVRRLSRKDFGMKELHELIDRAEQAGQWLRSPYQDLWFSPAELRDHIANGKFRWGVVNWELRDPTERMAQLHANVRAATLALSAFEARVIEAKA